MGKRIWLNDATLDAFHKLRRTGPEGHDPWTNLAAVVVDIVCAGLDSPGAIGDATLGDEDHCPACGTTDHVNPACPICTDVYDGPDSDVEYHPGSGISATFPPDVDDL